MRVGCLTGRTGKYPSDAHVTQAVEISEENEVQSRAEKQRKVVSGMGKKKQRRLKAPLLKRNRVL
ncbi:hypothetical protein PSSHI_00430 [Photobacterium sp. R1]